jgi:hypothetical protein
LQVFELVWGSLDYHIYMAAILPFLLALVAIRYGNKKFGTTEAVLLVSFQYLEI